MSKKVNLIGHTFGKLTVVERGEDYISPSGIHLKRWKCICECGSTINVTTSQLQRGLKSCGCVSRREDLTGQQFGKLTVLCSSEDYVSPKGFHMAKWHCRCECGKEIDVLGMSLKNGDTKSCGCSNHNSSSNLYRGGSSVNKNHNNYNSLSKKNSKKSPHNYIGEKLGQLTVLAELEPHITPNGSKQRIVKCQCSCGNVITIRLSAALKNGQCRECAGRERRNDLTGKRFGKLVVLSMADDYVSPSGYRLARCTCKCDCGNITIVNMSGLVTGKTKSCGCINNTAGLLKNVPQLVEKYDFDKNKEIGLDYTTLTARTSQKAWWKCNVCGNSWFATVASQNDKKEHGCPYCSGRLVIKGKTDLLTVFPEIAKEWDYEKNGSLLPEEISSKSSRKVWWKCSEGHIWRATVGNRTHNNSGCPRCNIEKVNSFCEQAVYYYVKQAFPDAINSDSHLNVELDIYIPSKKTAIEYDGEAWHATAKRIKNDEKKNNICLENDIELIRIREPKLPPIDNCYTIVRSDSIRNASLDKAIKDLLLYLGVDYIEVNTDYDSSYILEQYASKKYNNSLTICFPDIAAEWHPTKNGKLTPDEISKSSTKKVWWLGKCGHEWQAPVYDRTFSPRVDKTGRIHKPYGCPYCSGKRLLEGFNDLKTKYPDIAAEWHPTKNGNLTPTKTMPGSGKKVWWLGKCGHEWQASINHRCARKSQCPICFKKKKSPAVICVETSKEYENGDNAAHEMGMKNASSIYRCCRGKQKTAAGYHWMFAKNIKTII